nr:DUF86 domain-containing protein [Candidatus Sigynarchaeota archaeon]
MAEEKILEILAFLEKYLEELHELLPDDESDYLKNKVTRYAIERLIQLMIESVLDVCAILVKEFKLGPPRDEENMLDMLAPRIPQIEKIKEMRRFRNILVHRYGGINDILVYENVRDGLEDFPPIIASIKTVLHESRDSRKKK